MLRIEHDLTLPKRAQRDAVQASLEAKTKAAKRAEQAALQKAERAEHELAVARRECERAAGDAEDRKVQLSVLVETVETLQAGTPGSASVTGCIPAVKYSMSGSRACTTMQSHSVNPKLVFCMGDAALCLTRCRKASHLLCSQDLQSSLSALTCATDRGKLEVQWCDDSHCIHSITVTLTS